jgi:hypothetical protein
MIIFSETYYAESLPDLEQDVYEAIKNLPKDENGFTIGEFVVNIYHITDEQD